MRAPYFHNDDEANYQHAPKMARSNGRINRENGRVVWPTYKIRWVIVIGVRDSRFGFVAKIGVSRVSHNVGIKYQVEIGVRGAQSKDVEVHKKFVSN